VSLGEDTSTLLQTGGADLWEEPHVADDTHFVLYFVRMQGNTKHNMSDYVMFLTTTCTRWRSCDACRERRMGEGQCASVRQS